MTSLHIPEKYRPDIDGLRAVAVLLVVSYHYFQVRGGFVGVDIFFVISGYLISRQIFSDLARQSFSLMQFYARRIRRIFPPLILVIVTSLIAGWYLLLPPDFGALGKHASAGIAYVSNLLLWTEAGYFDAPSAQKPFLHFWSLGVEEQFYLFWPLLLIVLSRFPRATALGVAVVTLSSFVANLVLTKVARDAAFYLPVSRVWEFGLGAAVAYVSFNARSWSWGKLAGRILEPVRQVAFPAGVALIVVAAVSLDRDFAYPGYWALLPVFGSCLVIAAPVGSRLKSALFANPTAVFIGRISYGLYLWHWPILVGMHLTDRTSVTDKFVALGLSFCLAWASYRLVETPIRSIRVNRHTAPVFVGTGLLATLLVAACGLMFSTGLIERPWDKKLISKVYHEHAAGCFASGADGHASSPDSLDACMAIKYPGRPTVFLLGDSHAFGLYQGLGPYLDARRINLIALPVMYCTPMSTKDFRTACVAFNERITQKIQEIKPSLVVIFAHHQIWEDDEGYGEANAYPAYIWQKAQDIRKLGAAHVMILGQIPTWINSLPHDMNLNFLSHSLPVPDRTFVGLDPASLKMDESLRSVDANYPGVEYFSLRDNLCNERGCVVRLGPDYPEDLIVHDYGHLTKHGAIYISEAFLGKRILSLLQANPTPSQ